MLRKILRLSAVAAIAAATMLYATPAAAEPDCDGPLPPPICDRGSQAGGELITAKRLAAANEVTGWAIDADGVVTVRFTVDGKAAGTAIADKEYDGAGLGGFGASLPALPGTRVCATADDVGSGPGAALGCLDLSPNPVGTLDEVIRVGRSVRVRGTAGDPNQTEPLTVHILLDGGDAGTAVADQTGSGFVKEIPAWGGPGEHTVCVDGINVGPGTPEVRLGCLTYINPDPLTSPVVTSFYETVRTFYLSWTSEGPWVTGFRVELLDLDATWKVLHANLPATSRGYIISLLEPGSPYCVRVTSLGDFAEATSGTRCIQTKPVAYVERLFADPATITPTSLGIRWRAIYRWANYQVDLRRVSDGHTTTYLVPVHLDKPDYYTFTISGLDPDTAYQWDVRAMLTGHPLLPLYYWPPVKTGPAPIVWRAYGNHHASDGPAYNLRAWVVNADRLVVTRLDRDGSTTEVGRPTIENGRIEINDRTATEVPLGYRFTASGPAGETSAYCEWYIDSCNVLYEGAPAGT